MWVIAQQTSAGKRDWVTIRVKCTTTPSQFDLPRKTNKKGNSIEVEWVNEEELQSQTS